MSDPRTRVISVATKLLVQFSNNAIRRSALVKPVGGTPSEFRRTGALVEHLAMRAHKRDCASSHEGFVDTVEIKRMPSPYSDIQKVETGRKESLLPGVGGEQP